MAPSGSSFLPRSLLLTTSAGAGLIRTSESSIWMVTSLLVEFVVYFDSWEGLMRSGYNSWKSQNTYNLRMYACTYVLCMCSYVTLVFWAGFVCLPRAKI